MSNNPHHSQGLAPAGAGDYTDPPPAYSRTTNNTTNNTTNHTDNLLHVPTAQQSGQAGPSSDHTVSSNGGEVEGEEAIPMDDRRSMEEEMRELPKGWRREFDASTKHVFYVDTLAKPPRSIWVHPYDDPTFLASLPLSDPARHQSTQAESSSSGPASSSTSATSSGEDKRTLGRKLKDKMTGSTHDERVAERRHRQEEEMKAHQAFIMRRAAMVKAQQEGKYRPMYQAPPMQEYTVQRGRIPAYYQSGGYGYGYPGGAYPRGNNAYGYPATSAYGYPVRRRRGGGAMALGAGALGGLLIGDMMF